MAEEEGGGKAIGAVVAGLGVVGLGIAKVLSHAPVDDIARIGGRSLSEASTILDDVGRHVPAPGVVDDGARIGVTDMADVALNVGAAAYDGIVTRSEEEGIWLGDLSDPSRLAGNRGNIVGFVVREGADLSAWEAACLAAEAECWIYVGAAGAPEGAAIASWNASKEVPAPAEGFTVRVIGG